ncbi:MAG: metal-dependent hydrolase [archaeon]
MPSTVVHLALAGLIAAALLGAAFGPRPLAVVAALVILPDLDAFASLFIQGSHRALLHTLLVPLAIAAWIYYDTRISESSWLATRFDGQGPRVAWVAVLAMVLAGIGPDLVGAGTNLFYPLHDQFYQLNGRIELSNQRGLVQTVFELAPDSNNGGVGIGTTQDVHISSGIDPTAGDEPETVERLFPIVRSGTQLLLVVTSVVVVGLRLYESRDT